MNKYENLKVIGEGSYGIVYKCRQKKTGKIVAIKKFIDSEMDESVKNIAVREVRMLRLLHHENLIGLIETFQGRKGLYLVFEFMDYTLLDEVSRYLGLSENTCRRILWQILKGVEFCHLHNVIHRDIKPENILLSKSGMVKICDFGFARMLARPGETYTDYVATRWYRAPELLVGDTRYGRAVDIWAIGCVLSEMFTAEPLFPGESDIDQLFLISKCLGSLTQRHKEVFLRNPLFIGLRFPEVRNTVQLEVKLPGVPPDAISVLKNCLATDPEMRLSCTELKQLNWFVKDEFSAGFCHDLRQKLHQTQQKRQSQSLLLENKSVQQLNLNIERETSGVAVNVEKAKSADGEEDKKKSDLTSVVEVLKPKKDYRERVKHQEESFRKFQSVSEASSVLSKLLAIPVDHQTFKQADRQTAKQEDHQTSQTLRIPVENFGAKNINTNMSYNSAEMEHLTDCSYWNKNKRVKDFLTPSLCHITTGIPLIASGLRLKAQISNKVSKKAALLRKSLPDYQHHCHTIASLQPELMNSSFITSRSMEKCQPMNASSDDRYFDERSSVSLPEVKGADVYRSKEKQSIPYRRCSVSSIPHISGGGYYISSSPTQLNNTTGIKNKDFINTGLPNV